MFTMLWTLSLCWWALEAIPFASRHFWGNQSHWVSLQTTRIKLANHLTSWRWWYRKAIQFPPPPRPRLSSGVQTGAAQLSQQSKTRAEMVVVAKLPPPPPHINPQIEFVDWALHLYPKEETWSLSGHHSEDEMNVHWRMTPSKRVPQAELCAKCSS